jgi:hypothetical protein
MSNLGWLDLEALYVAVDRERRKRHLSWRQVAGEVGLAASVFTRVGHGYGGLSVHSFASMVVWAKLDANDFIKHG